MTLTNQFSNIYYLEDLSIAWKMNRSVPILKKLLSIVGWTINNPLSRHGRYSLFVM